MRGRGHRMWIVALQAKPPLSKRIMRFDLAGGCNKLTPWLAVILRPHLGNAYDI
ncbi:hypothetical protein OAV54_01505 [Planktomarina temperata]|nr:hypothetical protein [Planktomarina temperata]MDC0929598.1 hypothetical protein [Planktomarina temperata]MDC3340431.1 hypothetical protein [Planktomarina temperata]